MHGVKGSVLVVTVCVKFGEKVGELDNVVNSKNVCYREQSTESIQKVLDSGAYRFRWVCCQHVNVVKLVLIVIWEKIFLWSIFNIVTSLSVAHRV